MLNVSKVAKLKVQFFFTLISLEFLLKHLFHQVQNNRLKKTLKWTKT